VFAFGDRQVGARLDLLAEVVSNCFFVKRLAQHLRPSSVLGDREGIETSTSRDIQELRNPVARQHHTGPIVFRSGTLIACHRQVLSRAFCCLEVRTLLASLVHNRNWFAARLAITSISVTSLHLDDSEGNNRDGESIGSVALPLS